jgi:threonine 3-dehydrogenase
MLTLCKVAPGEGGIAVREVAEPTAGAGEIRIRVGAAGICGTDMQIYKWAPRMQRRMVLPRVLGHEVSGIVDQVGSGVTRLKAGDHVVLESHIFCGECTQCRRDQAHLCERTQYPGIDIDGGFSPFIVVPARIAWVITRPLEHEIAAMMEPFGIAVHAALEGTGVSGQTVLINGCGPIGLMCIAAARALGARSIIASDINPLRLKTAETLGADRVVNVSEVALADAAKDFTGGTGIDVGLEFSGTEAGFKAVFDALARGGEFRLVGAPAFPISVDFTQWLLKCPTMRNIHGRRIWKTWEQAMPLIYEKKVDLKPLVSHVLPVAEGARGFDLILQGQAVKPILVPA